MRAPIGTLKGNQRQAKHIVTSGFSAHAVGAHQVLIEEMVPQKRSVCMHSMLCPVYLPYSETPDNISCSFY